MTPELIEAVDQALRDRVFDRNGPHLAWTTVELARAALDAITAAGWTIVRNDELMLMDMRAKTFEQWETD